MCRAMWLHSTKLRLQLSPQRQIRQCLALRTQCNTGDYTGLIGQQCLVQFQFQFLPVKAVDALMVAVHS